MKHWGWFAAVSLLAGCGFIATPADRVVAETAADARAACDYYERLPNAKRTAQADAACRALRASCEGVGGAE